MPLVLCILPGVTVWCRLPVAGGCASARIDTGAGRQSLAGRDAIDTAFELGLPQLLAYFAGR